MTPLDLFTLVLTAAGLGFFVAGTVGLLRFPDTHSRLHALTKADNLGLGLIVLGLLPQTGSLWLAAKLLAVWALAMLAAATTAQLVARTALPRDLPAPQARVKRQSRAAIAAPPAGQTPAAAPRRPRP